MVQTPIAYTLTPDALQTRRYGPLAERARAMGRRRCDKIETTSDAKLDPEYGSPGTEKLCDVRCVRGAELNRSV